MYYIFPDDRKLVTFNLLLDYLLTMTITFD